MIIEFFIYLGSEENVSRIVSIFVWFLLLQILPKMEEAGSREEEGIWRIFWNFVISIEAFYYLAGGEWSLFGGTLAYTGSEVAEVEASFSKT